MLSGWEFSKDFLEEVTLFKQDLDVRVKFGQEGLLVGDGTMGELWSFKLQCLVLA